MSDDSFSQGQEQSRLIRDELRALRSDVEALVRREVERTGYPRQDVEAMVRKMVARELARQRRGARSALEYWLPGLAAVAVVLLLGVGWFGWRSFRPVGGATSSAVGPAGRAAGAGIAPGPATPAEPVAAEPLSPAERAAAYDSLLRAGPPELVRLIDRLEAESGDRDVRAAIAAWRDGVADAAARGLLHSALVQLVLSDEASRGLAIDGVILRDPCRGDSCGALLDLWRERGSEFGMPPFPVDGSPSAARLATAERVLVLSRIRPVRR